MCLTSTNGARTPTSEKIYNTVCRLYEAFLFGFRQFQVLLCVLLCCNGNVLSSCVWTDSSLTLVVLRVASVTIIALLFCACNWFTGRLVCGSNFLLFLDGWYLNLCKPTNVYWEWLWLSQHVTVTLLICSSADKPLWNFYDYHLFCSLVLKVSIVASIEHESSLVWDRQLICVSVRLLLLALSLGWTWYG